MAHTFKQQHPNNKGAGPLFVEMSSGHAYQLILAGPKVAQIQRFGKTRTISMDVLETAFRFLQSEDAARVYESGLWTVDIKKGTPFTQADEDTGDPEDEEDEDEDTGDLDG